MVIKNPPKLVLTARIESELKEQLVEEASQNEMNLSNYAEHCLKHFSANEKALQSSEQDNEMLQRRLNDAVSENRASQSENQRLREYNQDCQRANQKLSEQLMQSAQDIEALKSEVSQWEEAYQKQINIINRLENAVESANKMNKAIRLEIDHLNEEIKSLKNELSQRKDENMKLATDYAKLCQTQNELQTDLDSRLPIALEDEEIEKIMHNLADLQRHHEGYHYGELLVWALATSARNEKHTFSMYNLNDFKKRNPDFFTSKHVQL